MKKITLLFLFTFFTFQFIFAQTTYKRVVISDTSESTIQQLDALGIDLTCGAIILDHSIQIELSDVELLSIENANITYSVLIHDLTKFYKDRSVEDLPKARMQLEQEKLASSQKSYSISDIINNVGQYNECDEIDWSIPTNWNLNPNSSPNSFGGCLTYTMVLAELDAMRAQYPNLITAKTDASVTPTDPAVDVTFEGRTVYYVRISDNPDTDEAEEPETLYQSLIHSRESATIMNQLFFMWYLLENYATDTAVKNLVDNHALYFIPVFNPDGFVWNQTQAPDGGGLQRKNRNTSAAGSCSTYLEGVDLNRNSAYYWGNGGSSTNSCSDTYMGTAPFSENETQIMRDFCLDHDFKLALNHHSFKNAMLHAYAGTTITNPRPDEYSKYNHEMTYYNRYAHGPSTSISSLNSGNMNDWMLGGPAGVSANGTPTGTGSGKNTMAWTPENGTSSEAGPTGSGFWPAPSNFLPIARRAMRMNFLAAYFSGKYAKLHDLNQSDITGAGSLSFAIENLGQNGNDTTPSTNLFTLTVTAVSSNITITTATASENFTAAQILEQRIVNIPYTLDGGIQADDDIEFKVVLTNDNASGNVLYEANIVKRYTPNTLFSDDPDSDNLTNWTQTGTWSTTSDAYSGTTAITSTSSFPYAASDSKQLQMNGSIDLTGKPTVLIQYFAKWDLERSFDYTQLEGSIDGSNWFPLCGKLTKPGAPDDNNTYSGKTGANNDFQPDGEPLYDGDTQDKWAMEEIVIDATTNAFLLNENTVYLRFNFNTDSTNRQDSYYNADFEGFSFDDFKVIEISDPICDGIASYPYSEIWDSGVGQWKQASGDDGNWTYNSGGTASPNTGPNNDFSGSGNYYYTEASVGADPGTNATVYLLSPCIDLDNYINASFSFYYHMYGSEMGSLDLEVSTDRGLTWSNLVTLSGQQQANQSDAWLQQTVNLMAYDGQVIHLRFVGNTGTGFRSDISIDQLNLTADEDTLSIPNSELTGFNVHPNPFNDTIKINFANSINSDHLSISLYDLRGRLVFESNALNIQNNTIYINDMNDLSSGSYFLRIFDTIQGKYTVKQLIKQ